MNTIELCRLATEGSAQLFRPAKVGTGYDAKPHTGKKLKGWVVLDSWTGSCVVAVHDKLDPINQAKFAALSVQAAAGIAFRLMGK